MRTSLTLPAVFAGSGMAHWPAGKMVKPLVGNAAGRGAPLGESRTRVLVVEDDASIRRLVERALLWEGFTVDVVATGYAALRAIQHAPPDLIVLDLMLPDLDGLEVCRRIRMAQAASDHPASGVLMLTARVAVPERVAGLGAGADDYLGKPFAVEEFVARVHAVLRRRQVISQDTGAHPLQFDDLTVDVRTRTAVRAGRVLQLSTREFDLLTFFLRHPNVVLSQDVIKDGVWGEDFFGESNVVAVVVRALRRELEAGGAARLIQTIRGAGYVLRQA